MSAAPDDDELVDRPRSRPGRSVPPPAPGGVGPPPLPGTGPRPMGVPPRPPSAPAPSEPPPEPEALPRWSDLVGRTFAGRLEATGKPAVVRVVRAGIRHDPPPEGVGLPVWAESSSSPQRYEIPVPWAGKPEEARSLLELGAELRAAQPGPSVSKRQELADVVERLLNLTEALHANGYRLGLVTPANVLWQNPAAARRAILPDYGFYRAADAGSLEEPAWLDPEFPFAPLWAGAGGSPGPKEIQAVSPRSAKWVQVELPDPRTDIRTLARLFACVLTGAPEGPLRPGRADQKAKVWHQVLFPAEQGRFDTVEKFRRVLAEFPLWHHFVEPTAPAPPAEGPRESASPAPRRLLPLLTAAVLLGGLALVGWLVLGGSKSGGTGGSTPPAPTDGGRDAEWDGWVLNWKGEFGKLVQRDRSGPEKATRDAMRKALDDFERRVAEKPVGHAGQKAEVERTLKESREEFEKLPPLPVIDVGREKWLVDWTEQFDRLWSSDGAARASPKTGEELWKLVDALDLRLRTAPAANGEQKAAEEQVLKQRRKQVGNLWPR